MKNKQVISYAVIGLVLAILGFANFLSDRGSLTNLFNRGQALSTQTNIATDAPLELSDLDRLQQASVAGETTANVTAGAGIIIEPNLIKIEATKSGQTAFALLLESVPNVKYKQYDFGFFIESINDLTGNDSNFWAFYLNGEKSPTGADSVVLNAGEVIEFKYEKIEF